MGRLIEAVRIAAVLIEAVRIVKPPAVLGKVVVGPAVVEGPAGRHLPSGLLNTP